MWSPGLVEAIKVAIKDFALASTSQTDSKINQLKRMSMAEWRQHVRQNHVPFRRDCRLCVEEMGQDVPHRRRPHKGGESVYVLSVDIAGPFFKGMDYATGHEARYALLATVPVPVGATGEATEAEARALLGRPGDDGDVGLHAAEDAGAKEPHAPQEPHGDDVKIGDDGVAQDAAPAAAPASKGSGGRGRSEQRPDPLEPLPEPAADEPNVDDPENAGEGLLGEAEKSLCERLNERWRKERDAAVEPIEIQNITVMEPLASRATAEVILAMDKVWAKFRSLGIPIFRLHSDRACELVGRQAQAWAGKHQLWHTATSGDDPPANGRIEAEVCQWKRRLRLTLKSSRAAVEEWPNVGRHVAEERHRAQLRRVGAPSHGMLPYNQRVLVKQKWWNKLKAKGLASPYASGILKGPSPLMSNGWVVKLANKDKFQHARAVLLPDPQADDAMMELVEDDGRPPHRLVGKQPFHPHLKVPLPRLMPATHPPPAGDAPADDDDYEPSLAPELPALEDVKEGDGDEAAPEADVQLSALKVGPSLSAELCPGSGGAQRAELCALSGGAQPSGLSQHACGAHGPELCAGPCGAQHAELCARAGGARGPELCAGPGGALSSQLPPSGCSAESDDGVVPTMLAGGESVVPFLSPLMPTAGTPRFGAGTTSGTSSTLQTLTSQTSSTLPSTGNSSTLGALSTLGSSGPGEIQAQPQLEPPEPLKTWPLDGTVEDYEKLLSDEHHGWLQALREHLRELPEDGESGQRQGSLVGEMNHRVMSLEAELNTRSPR